MPGFRFIPIILVSITFSFVSGCGDDENTVVRPTQNYELSDQEKKNAERVKEEMAKQRRQ